jgi:transcriptional regulator with XRE-family HTH domain
MSIRDRLIALRPNRDLSQQQMADFIGVQVTQILRYEAGATQPSLDVLKKLAVSMSVTIDSIVFDEDEKKIAKAVLESLILKHNAKRAFTGQLKEEQ